MGMYRAEYIGSYRMSAVSGAATGIAAATATAGHIWAFRWASSTKVCRPRRLGVQCMLTTAFGAAQEVGFDVVPARGYSASHTAGNALTLTGNNGKMRTSSPTTSVSDIRVAGAAALTAGTHTLDAQPIAYGSFYASAIGAAMARQVFDWNADETSPPYVLEQNDGLVGRNTILMGATGVVRWVFDFEWDEYALV